MFKELIETVEKAEAKTTKRKASLISTVSIAVPVPDGFNASQTIINNTEVDLMVLDGVASSDTASEVLYEQILKVLTATNGNTIIKAGTSATFTLKDSYYDSDAKEWDYSYCYNLMIVQALNLFPVKIAGVLPNDDWSGFNDITVTQGNEKTKTAGDWQNMVDSQAFQQNLMAYPDSIMATQFSNACNDSMNNSNSDDDIDSKINTFFAGTDNYKNVTLNSLTAVQTYWGIFPYIWAGYTPGKSYYLYSSDSSTVTYVGSLDITAPAAAPASIDKTLPGFSLSFTPADTKQSKKTLQYVTGQFVDSISTTTVALKGIYQLKSQFTNVATDNTIMAFMSGSVNGSKVIGYNEKLTQDSNGNWSGLYTMLHPKDAAGWMTLILELGAIVMTLEMFSRPLKYLWDKYRESKGKNKGEDPSKTDADKMRTDAKTKQTQDSADAQRTMDRMAHDITIKIEITNYNVDITQVQTDRTNRVTEDSRSNYTDITNRQVDSVKTLSKYGVDAKIGEMSTKIGQNKQTLDPAKTSTQDLAGKLDGVKTNADSVHTSLPVEATKLAGKTTTAEKAALDVAKKANDEALETQKEIDKNKDTKDKGDDGDVELDDLPKGEK